MLSNSHSRNVGRYPVFPLSLNSFYSISRKWGTKYWFHQLLLLMFIFLGPWVILIHLISSIKKPTKSPSNSLQWICPLGIPKLSLEISPKCIREGEIGSVGCLRKRVEIGSFMIWINAWHSRCPGWIRMIHSWFLHLISDPMPLMPLYLLTVQWRALWPMFICWPALELLDQCSLMNTWVPDPRN